MSYEDNLSSRLQDDITWRIRELSEVVRACDDTRNSTRQNALTRASAPIIYAHWEGFFVYSTNLYLNFLSQKRLNVKDLKDEFWALTIRKLYNPNQISSDTSFRSFLLELRSLSDSTFKKGRFEKINGQSNLKSNVLIACCKSICIDSDVYKDYFDFIDNHLIVARNFIAHGNSMRFDKERAAEYRDKVVELMRITQNEIENAAILKRYKK